MIRNALATETAPSEDLLVPFIRSSCGSGNCNESRDRSHCSKLYVYLLLLANLLFLALGFLSGFASNQRMEISNLNATTYFSSMGFAHKSTNNVTCYCQVTADLLPPYIQGPLLERGKSARFLFILGYPYTGTSAIHFILGTSGNVSTLYENNIMGPHKEGWYITGLRRRHDEKDRWGGKAILRTWLNMTELAADYYKLWNKEKPLLIENSPPEIQFPYEMYEAFSKHGKVRFLLLVRGFCSGSVSRVTHEKRLRKYKHIIDLFPRDTFVLRYEDLCFHWHAVREELVGWEPLLSDVDISTRPSGSRSRRALLPVHHLHAQKSIKEYCESKVFDWERREKNKESDDIEFRTRRGFCFEIENFGS